MINRVLSMVELEKEEKLKKHTRNMYIMLCDQNVMKKKIVENNKMPIDIMEKLQFAQS